MEPTNPYKVGQKVKILHTDYAPVFPVGSIGTVQATVDSIGVELSHPKHPTGLYFDTKEIEPYWADYGVPTGGVPRVVTAVPEGFENLKDKPYATLDRRIVVTKKPDLNDILRERLNPLNVQISGDHYKNLSIQPIEYIMANSIPYSEGNIIKYVTRWRNKGGIKDLEKARHYIDLLIAEEAKNG
jgi:hypothetical protein